MMNKAEEKAVFCVGSCAFFGKIIGFESKDKDYVHLMDGWFLNQCGVAVKIDGCDRFLYPNKGLALIDDCLKQDDPLTAGKFLVPEFCEYIGATLDDIKRLKPLFERIDEKHRYETFIYECYVKNNGLWLTEEQRLKAYEIYKTARQ